MASLYDIDARLSNIFITDGVGIDETTGEVLDAAALETLQMEKWEKVDNICRFIKNLESDAAQYRAESDRLRKRMDTANKKAEQLKTYLSMHLDQGQKADVPSAQIRWRKSQAVTIADESLLPSAFIKTVTETKPDKAAIRDHLKKGHAVPGACLEEKQNLIIK